jgi:UrcA family protein
MLERQQKVSQTMLRTLPLLAAALMVSSAALAQAPREPTQVTVSIKGVNFANPTDVAQLYRRLSIAADKACDSDIDTQSAHAQDRTCAAKALNDAVQSTHQPALVAMLGADANLKVASNRP